METSVAKIRCDFWLSNASQRVSRNARGAFTLRHHVSNGRMSPFEFLKTASLTSVAKFAETTVCKTTYTPAHSAHTRYSVILINFSGPEKCHCFAIALMTFSHFSGLSTNPLPAFFECTSSPSIVISNQPVGFSIGSPSMSYS